MLAELEAKDSSMAMVSINQIRQNNSFRGRNRVNRPFGRGTSNGRGIYGTPRPRVNNNSGCIRCIEAGRYDASKFHIVRDCPYPRTQQNYSKPGVKVFMIQDQSSNQGSESCQQGYEESFSNGYENMNFHPEYPTEEQNFNDHQSAAQYVYESDL